MYFKNDVKSNSEISKRGALSDSIRTNLDYLEIDKHSWFFCFSGKSPLPEGDSNNIPGYQNCHDLGLSDTVDSKDLVLAFQSRFICYKTCEQLAT